MYGTEVVDDCVYFLALDSVIHFSLDLLPVLKLLWLANNISRTLSVLHIHM